MRRVLVMGFALAVFGGQAAHPADAPAIVIPGKAGVPVIINGVDASYAIIEGDWGLDRPGSVYPTIIPGPLIAPEAGRARGYFPAVGRQPGYGRYEIEPPANRRLPPPAPSYHRSWTSASDPLPASMDPPTPPPQIIAAPPQSGRRSFRKPNGPKNPSPHN